MIIVARLRRPDGADQAGTVSAGFALYSWIASYTLV